MLRCIVLFLLSGCATPGLSFFVGDWSGESKMMSGKTTTLEWHVRSCGESCLEGEAFAHALQVKAKDKWTRTESGFERAYSDDSGSKGTLRSRGWNGAQWLWEGDVNSPDQPPLKMRELITRIDEHTMHARYEFFEGEWKFFSEETLKKTKR